VLTLLKLSLAIRSLLILDSQSQIFLLDKRKTGSNRFLIKLAAEAHLRSQLSVFDEFTLEVSDLHNRHHWNDSDCNFLRFDDSDLYFFFATFDLFVNE
jgi:hypothetical protein